MALWGKAAQSPRGLQDADKDIIASYVSTLVRWHPGRKNLPSPSPGWHKDDGKHLSAAKALVLEIDKHLPGGFRALSSSERDAAFKVAFNAMALSFELPTDNSSQKRKALEITAYTILYTKFHLPSKMKRDSSPA